jgi:outer membrane protein OmpA-like peptidoglycan-associated protein
VDNEEDPNTLFVRLEDWTEKQKTGFFDIPLMVAFQHKFGATKMNGFYFGLGLKFQVPLSSTFSRSSGTVHVSAYYPEDELPLGDGYYGVELPNHNLGTNKERLWSGKSDLKFGLGLTGELGFLIGISRRVDLRLGIMADYGLMNIKKQAKSLLEVTGVQQEGKFTADKVKYDGVLNSNLTGSIHPFSINLCVGLRVKIGRLKYVEEPESLSEDHGYRDTIIVNVNVQKDTVIVNLPENFDLYQRGKSGRSDNPDFRRLSIPSWYLLEDDENITDPASVEQILAKVASVSATIDGSIYFDLGKYDLKPASIVVLDQKIALLKKYPEMKVSLVGHTCDIGGENLNMTLSKNRANMARLYMISQGISSVRLQEVPMGKIMPTYSNATENSKSMNRRVDFKVAE